MSELLRAVAASQSQDQSNPAGSHCNHSQQRPQSFIPFTRRRREVKREAILSRALNTKPPISLSHDAETTEEEWRRLGVVVVVVGGGCILSDVLRSAERGTPPKVFAALDRPPPWKLASAHEGKSFKSHTNCQNVISRQSFQLLP